MAATNPRSCVAGRAIAGKEISPQPLSMVCVEPWRGLPVQPGRPDRHLDSMSDPQTDLDINTSAQLSILEACAGLRGLA